MGGKAASKDPERGVMHPNLPLMKTANAARRCLTRLLTPHSKRLASKWHPLRLSAGLSLGLSAQAPLLTMA